MVDIIQVKFKRSYDVKIASIRIANPNLTPVSCYNIKEEIVTFYRIKLLQIND